MIYNLIRRTIKMGNSFILHDRSKIFTLSDVPKTVFNMVLNQADTSMVSFGIRCLMEFRNAPSRVYFKPLSLSLSIHVESYENLINVFDGFSSFPKSKILRNLLTRFFIRNWDQAIVLKVS